MSNRWINFKDSQLDIIKQSLEMLFKGKDKNVNPIVNKINRSLKKIKTSSAKGKGRNLQYWVCEKISELTRIPYVQKDDSCDIHSREMGQAGIDVILRGEALKKFPFSVECKATENLNLYDAILQAQQNQYKNTDWLVVNRKKNYPQPIVFMGWDTFEKLYNKRK